MKYNKYSNKKVKLDGYIFDSRKEARRYSELKLLLKAGKITDLILQPSFTLQESFKLHGKTHRAIIYVADFKYIKENTIIIEDTKGYLTDVYKMKKKLFLFRYGSELEFREL